MTIEPLSDERLAEIRAGLEGVTPGPWVYSEEEGGDELISSPGERGDVHWDTKYYPSGLRSADAAHIARCSPDTILALLSRLDKAEADRNAVAGAFRWFYKYPEFTPSPDLQERWTADIQTAVDALGWKRSPDFTPFPRPLPPPPSES